MISENQIKETERRALSLLFEVKNWSRDEISSLQLVFAEIPELKEGEIMIMNANTSVTNRQEADLLAAYMLKVFQVHSVFQSNHEGSHKATLQGSKTIDGFWAPVSPWFMIWYSYLHSIDPSIKRLVRKLHDCERNNPQLLYRGESKEYPSVRSTLSRHLRTTNANVLSIVQKDEAISIKASHIVSTNSDIAGTLQHIGGKSNCIDFSGIPWVALYFACKADPTEGGIIWGYDRNQQVDGITFREPNPENDIAEGRIENQAGWVIEPDTGIIEDQYLIKVATIPSELKPTLIQFLEQANISENTMFPDLLNVVQTGQRTLSLDAIVHLWIDCLKAGEFDRVFQESNNLVNQVELERDRLGLNHHRTSLYFRGLSLALLGNIQQAEKDLRESSKMFKKHEMPKVLQKNMSLIQSARRSGDVSRLNKRLSLEVNASLWKLSFPGYKFLGEF